MKRTRKSEVEPLSAAAGEHLLHRPPLTETPGRRRAHNLIRRLNFLHHGILFFLLHY